VCQAGQEKDVCARLMDFALEVHPSLGARQGEDIHDVSLEGDHGSYDHAHAGHDTAQ
jgi:hypothetical protein